MSETLISTNGHTEEIAPEWRVWGPYLSERQWGTVREDYSEGGAAWDFFPHDHARSRAYRWGEDGIMGISDERQRLCFALALWNGQDSIIKERLFGLTGSQGNHGEDVKEVYYYLDATPDHAYLKGLYKYPQRAFPYEDLVEENRRRGRDQPEYELVDTGAFSDDRYFDVTVEYAKAAPQDVLIQISATNRGPEPAPLQLLPTLWFRNTWSWGRHNDRPTLTAASQSGPKEFGRSLVRAHDPVIGDYWLHGTGTPDLLFTENETNVQRLWGGSNDSPFVKDGINDAIVHGAMDRVNPEQRGTKFAARYEFTVSPGETATVTLRLADMEMTKPLVDAELFLAERRSQADGFYAAHSEPQLTDDERAVRRQALSGLIWSKQYYGYDVTEWLEGDPAGPPPPESRRYGRNSEWQHHNSGDVISMPDKWEYPWYAAWDLAFHCTAFGSIDPGFAKDQLLLMLREWYMHSNGQLPAYEWAFGDVNPPVHALAALRIYLDEQARTGEGDYAFLARVFHKLLLNFTWWVNRKDAEGRNVFQGGFLGLDNISVFDRSAMPPGASLEQSDATAWMATYCLSLGAMAVELAQRESAYEDVATKFMEHFFAIGGALNGLEAGTASLWSEEDGFYFDQLHLPDGSVMPLKVYSLVGLIPLIASISIVPRVEQRAPNLVRDFRWLINRRPELEALAPLRTTSDGSGRRLLTIVPEERLRRILQRMLDPDQFLGDYGIRSISKAHTQPYELHVGDQTFSIKYEPAESSTGMFGGNSNWRGPIWFPVNFLLIGGLRRMHGFYGDEFKVEYPTGTGNYASLGEVADDLSRRLVKIFLRGADGRRPVFGGSEIYQSDPNWRDHLLFYEYFHGDNGAGIGASHQTGWTALVATLLDRPLDLAPEAFKVTEKQRRAEPAPSAKRREAVRPGS